MGPPISASTSIPAIRTPGFSFDGKRATTTTMELCAVFAAGTGLSARTAAPAQQTVLIRIERPVFAQSGLLRARGVDRGMDCQAARQLEYLMRVRATGRSLGAGCRSSTQTRFCVQPSLEPPAE